MPIADLIVLILQYTPEAWSIIQSLIDDLRAKGAIAATPEQLAKLQSDLAVMDAELKIVEQQ